MHQASYPSGHSQTSRSSDIDLDYELTHGFARTLIRKLVKRTSSRIPLNEADCEDFEQILALEIGRRASRFDPQRGTWESFAGTVIQRRLKSEIHRYCRRRTNEPRPRGRCDEVLGRHEGPQRLSDLKLDLPHLLDRLTEEERQLFQAIAQTSVRSVSRELGIPRRTLRDRLARIRKRIGDHPLHEKFPKKD